MCGRKSIWTACWICFNTPQTKSSPLWPNDLPKRTVFVCRFTNFLVLFADALRLCNALFGPCVAAQVLTGVLGDCLGVPGPHPIEVAVHLLDIEIPCIALRDEQRRHARLLRYIFQAEQPAPVGTVAGLLAIPHKGQRLVFCDAHFAAVHQRPDRQRRDLKNP